MHWRVLIVAFIAVIAGCGSVGGLGSDAPTETVTPAPVPTPPPTPEDPRMGLAPGVNASGIFDANYLVEHHVEAATGTSYVWVERERRHYRARNTTLRTNRTQHVVVENATTYRRYATSLERYIEGTLAFLQSYRAYADGERQYERWIQLGEAELIYRRGPAENVSREFASLPAGTFRHYLVLEDQRVERLSSVGERPHYRITGTRPAVGRFSDADNYTATAVVREDGFVRSVEVSFDRTRADQRVHVTYTSRYTHVGNATVTEPAWVDDVREHFDEE